MNGNDNGLVYLGRPVTLNSLESVLATEVHNKIHFYIGFNNTAIYYSIDEDTSWTQTSSTNNKRNVEDIQLTQPNICFKGFLELNMPTDNGRNWAINSNRLGSSITSKAHYVWDLQFIKTFDKENGGNITFVGLDFGSYYTSSPNVWTSWKSINKGSSTMLSYDAATSEKHKYLISAE